jgi:hypothetical protein
MDEWYLKTKLETVCKIIFRRFYLKPSVNLQTVSLKPSENLYLQTVHLNRL